MSEIIRDPFWQFIGVIFTVVSIVIVILQIKRKELSYNIIINTPLLSIDKQIEDKITILYEDATVDNLQLIILRVCNTGNTPIEKSDYERPISFSFGKDSFIFAESVLDKKPENLKITFQKEKDKIIFYPILLNKKDEFSIKVFVNNYKGEINPDCRIVGVKDFKGQSRKREPEMLVPGLGISIAIGVLTYNFARVFFPNINQIFEIVFMVGWFILFVTKFW